MSSVTLLVGNDSTIKLNGLKDQEGNAVTNATVEITIQDFSGSNVSGVTQPISLSHTSDGDYEADLDKSIDVKAGQYYYMEITATSGNADAKWSETVKAENREF